MNYLYCIKDYIINEAKSAYYEKLFDEGKKYTYDIELNGSYFIYYDKFNPDSFSKGFRFYLTDEGKFLNKVSDYFMTEKEYRKLKLEKINSYAKIG